MDLNGRYLTIKDFEMNEVVVVERGTKSKFDDKLWSEGNINTSTILTKLIQDTGRFCERYASELFMAWEHMMIDIDGWNTRQGEVRFLFGIRKDGVDYDNFVVAKVNRYNTSYLNEMYRKLYMIEVTIDTDKSCDDYVNLTMELGEARI